jgi:CheY-like chemotaxis protein
MAKVLLVDDSVPALQSMEGALRVAGYEVDKATSLGDALRKATANRPDIMVVDVMMPDGLEGFGLVWVIRECTEGTLSHVPIIMVTGIEEQTSASYLGHLPHGLTEPDKTMDVQGWLPKPVPAPVLLETVGSALGTALGLHFS